MCLGEKLECVSNLKVDFSDCLQQCSGVLITSYEAKELHDRVSNLAMKVGEMADMLYWYLDDIDSESFSEGTIQLSILQKL